MEKSGISVATLLRMKAEKLLISRPQEEVSITKEGDILKLLHELEVYSVELELQNQELLNANYDALYVAEKIKFSENVKQRIIHDFEVNEVELQIQNEELLLSNTISQDVAERYSDLFNFSSSGYLILSKEGEILDLNFTGAGLLGKDRFELKNSMFGFFVSDSYKSIYNNFLKNIFEKKTKVTCEVSLTLEDSNSIVVLLSGILTQNGDQCLMTVLNITEQKQTLKYRDLTREILQLLIEPGSIKESLHQTLKILKDRTGFDAVGIRLQEGIDYPYLDQSGFTSDFMLTENSLLEMDKKGRVCLDKNGNPRLGCTCGLVISGNANPTNPNVTSGGTWWTNDSFQLLDVSTNDDERFHPRNRCIHEGYASIALVPIRNKDKIVGLIQLNDRHKDVFNLNKIEYLEGIALHIGSELVRKQAEETLRKNEELLRTITENAPDIIIQLDEQGTILYMNRAMPGYIMEECIGKNFCEWTMPEYHVLMNQSLELVFNESANQTYLSKGYDLNGETRWYRTGISPVQDEGKVEKAILITRDITESILNEEILRESEENKNAIIQSAMDGFWIADRRGCILEVNTKYCNMIGYSRQELLTMRIQDLEVTENEEDAVSHIEKVLKTGEERFETRHKSKDGSILYVEVSVQYREVNGGQFISFIHDISKRKQREKAMSESNEQFRLLFENSLDAILFTNPDGTIYSVNPEAERMFGRSQEEIIRLNKDFISDVNDSRLIPALEERKKNGHFKGELNYLRKDGTSFPVDMTTTLFKDSNGIERSSIIARDITERKKAEESLRQSNERYKSLFEDNHSVMLIIHPETGEIVDANPTACRYYGWTHAEICNRNIDNINTLSTQEIAAEMQLAKEEQRNHFFFRHRMATNEIRDVEVYSGPIQFGEENLLYSLVHDITERKQNEEALHQSEERYKSLFKNNHSVMMLLNPDTGEIIDANPSACNFYGWSHSELCRKNISEIDPLPKEELNQKLQNSKIESVNHLFVQHRLANGELKDVEIYSGPIQFNESTLLYTIIHDITEKKLVEEALRASERRMDAVFNSVTETIIMLDTKGTILAANNTAANRWGLTPGEMTGENMFELAPSELRKIRFEQIQELIETGTPIRFEEHHDGQIFDITFYPIKESSGNIRQFVVFNRDITEKRKSQELLRAHEERYSLIYNSSRDSIFSFDLSGRITSANRSFCEEVKLDISDILGNTFSGLGLPEILTMEQENLTSKVIETNNTVISELKIPVSDGSVRYYEIILNPMHDGNGNIIGIGGSARNITKRKNADHALLESEKRFRNLVKDLPVGIIQFGSRGEVIMNNPKAVELLGLNDDQIKNKYTPDDDWSMIREDGSQYPKEERPIPKTFRTGEQQKGVVVGVYRETTSDYVWLLIDTVIVFKEDGTIRNVVGTFIDITGIKKAERALKESEEKFRKLVWDMQVGVILQGPRAEILMINPKALELLGLTEDQLSGITSFDPDWNVIHEDGSPFPGEMQPVSVAIATGQPVKNVVMGVYNPTLEDWIWLLFHAVPETGVDGKLKQVVCTFIDISELKNTQQELREREFFFRESQHAGFIGSYKTDFNTGKWESSEVLDHIFGIDSSYNRSVEGWLNIAHPDDRDMMNHYLLEEVLMKGAQFNKEYRIVRKKDNITRWVHGLGRVDFDSDNVVKSLVGTIQDITERKIKEEALLKFNLTLTALSKSSQAMLKSTNEEDYLKQVCKIVTEDTDFAMVWIGYAEDDEAKTVRPVASAGFNDDYLNSIKVSWGDNEFGHGPTGVAIRTGEVGMCNNMLTDPTFEPWRDQALKYGFASSIVFPLKNGEKVFGAFTVYSKEPDSFLDVEIKLLTELANDLAQGITTIRLRAAHQLAEEALIKSHGELEVLVKERTSELMKSNDALKVTEEKYRTVSDFATNWEFWTAPGDQMIYCSPSCERVTGYTSTEFLVNPQLLVDIVHHDDLPEYLEHREKEKIATKCDHEIQYRIFKKDGSVRWIGHFCRPVYDESGLFKGTRGSNRDITARKKMEELLTTSNQKYKMLSENITDGIFICKNGKFEYVNKAIYDIFGYEGHELERMKLTQLVASDNNEKLEKILYSSDLINRSLNIELECLKKDLSIIFVEILLNYVSKDKMVYGVIHDITDKKELQKNMVKAIIQTEEKERTHFSKELHDGLGPLLSTIKLYLQWSERPNSNKSREEIIGKAGEILEEALGTVKEISSKLSPHLLTNYGLSSAIKSFVEKLNATAAYDIVFESNTVRRFGSEIEASLYRAIIECINNTMKYAHAKSIYINLHDTGSQIQLDYRDDGIGFDIKETLSKQKGLGLFNLQNRLHTMGGKVDLFSEPGKGVEYLFVVNV